MACCRGHGDLPVWIEEAAMRLLEAAAPFSPGSVLPQALQIYHARVLVEMKRSTGTVCHGNKR